MHDLGVPKFFLGIEIARSQVGIYLSQHKYAIELLTDASYIGCRTSFASMEPNISLYKIDGYLLYNPTKYRHLVGRLIYMAIIRPNLCLMVNKLSQFVSSPCTKHMKVAYKVLCTLKEQ